MATDITVREVTVPLTACPAVAGNEELKKAVNRLKTALQEGYPFVLVYDQEEQPVGFLCPRTVLELFEPEFIVTAKWSLPVHWDGFIMDRSRNLERTPVKEAMRPLNSLPVVETNDSLAKTIHLMLDRNTNALPVTDGETVIGMVHIGSIIERLLN